MASQIAVSRREYLATLAGIKTTAATTELGITTAETVQADNAELLVIGYYDTGDSNKYTPENIPFEKLTDVIYHQLEPDTDGNISTPTEAGDNSEFETVKDTSKADTRVHVSIGHGDTITESEFADVIADEESRDNFAKTAADLVDSDNLDGIDIDWEPQASQNPPRGWTKTKAENYLCLLDACREQLDKVCDGTKYHLTIAATDGLAKQLHQLRETNPLITQFIDFIDIIDRIHVMTYDYHGKWVTDDEESDGGPPTGPTGFNAPLHTPSNPEIANNNSVVDTMTMWSDELQSWTDLPQIPSANMLVTGLPFYGRRYKLVSDVSEDETPGLGEMFAKRTVHSVSYSEIVDQYLADSNYKRYWHGESEVPWLYSAEDNVFITYDDPYSISRKVDYTRNNGFAGVMVWELTDDPEEELLDAVVTNLIIDRQDFTRDGKDDIRALNQHLFAQLNSADLTSRNIVSAIGRASEPETSVVAPIETRLPNPKGTRPTYETTHEFTISADAGDERAYRVRRSYTYDSVEQRLVTDVETTVPRNAEYVRISVTLQNAGEVSLRIEQPPNTIHQGMHLFEGLQLARRMDSDPRYAFYLGGLGGATFQEIPMWTTFQGTEWATFYDDDAGMTFGLLSGATAPHMWIEEDAHLDFLVEPVTLAPGDEVTYTAMIAVHEGGEDAPARGEQLFDQARGDIS